MVHARLNGFVNHHYDKEAEVSGKFGKGGFTLRDDLYAIAKKQRKNSNFVTSRRCKALSIIVYKEVPLGHREAHLGTHVFFH